MYEGKTDRVDPTRAFLRMAAKKGVSPGRKEFASFISICPHCLNRTVHEPLFTLKTGASVRRISAYGEYGCKCQTCAKVSLWRVNIDIFDHTISAGPVFPAIQTLPRNVPDDVRALYDEAVLVSRTSPSSYAVLVGRAIEALCEAHGVTKGPLASRVRALGEQLGMPKPFIEMALGIKELRNLGAHYAQARIETKHVAVLDDLFMALIDYLYVSPVRIERFREAAHQLRNVVKGFKQWIVSVDGLYPRDDPGYLIDADRLDEEDWVGHMLDKDRVNIEDFCDALYFAREHFKLGHHDRSHVHELKGHFWKDRKGEVDHIVIDPFDWPGIHQHYDKSLEASIVPKAEYRSYR